VLAIEHVGEAGFVLKRLSASDVKSLDAVTVPSPYEFPVEGQPNSNLMRELRWYLEDFLDYPFHPETLKAEHVLDALRGWGKAAFNALFNRRDAGTWLGGAGTLHVRSDDPNILSWPWEALFDPQLSYVSQHLSVERRLNKIADPPDLGTLPTDCVNILLVVARPYEADVFKARGTRHPPTPVCSTIPGLFRPTVRPSRLRASSTGRAHLRLRARGTAPIDA